MTMHPLVGLLRRFAIDFFNGHDAAVCREIMAPDYRLRVGDSVMLGRDEQYLPAVQSQLDQFPGMGMTVHGLITDGEQIALHFSEHGASGGAGGRVAAWPGVALYRGNGTQLVSCAAEEDYAARRRQLRTGVVDPISAPTPAPWDTVVQPRNEAAELTVRAWLTDGVCAAPGDGLLRDDEHLGLAPPLVFEAATTVVNELFSAGADVAFHVKQTGRYVSGFADLGPSSPLTLISAGMVTVADGRVVSGRVVRDRAGLHRAVAAR